MYKVVCGFNGMVYSKHNTEKAALAKAEKVKAKLRNPNCGCLAGYVQVVPADAYFTNIADADNDCGCIALSQKFWKTPNG